MLSAPVFRPRPDAIQALFGRSHAVIGVIHCLPFPGAPDYEGMQVAEIAAHAVAEAHRYARGGVDGL
ncbi:MAG: BtpA family membrane complex biogenesis protein, partial [Acetobacteraceae bacterium]|nr:BtpA family membrane complex biogenesis protein [Acetobacteraceae bacterium]